jgi:hypothetical protein
MIGFAFGDVGLTFGQYDCLDGHGYCETMPTLLLAMRHDELRA